MSEEMKGPYEDVELKALLDEVRTRFGEDLLREVKELQVGYGSRVMRSDDSGLWLGAKTFATAPFSVDMDGNVIVKSLKTNTTGQHIEIDSANTNQIRFYDGTTLFGLLEVDYNGVDDIGYLKFLAQDLSGGLEIDVGVGASTYSSARLFSVGGSFETNGNTSTGYNSIFGKNGDPGAGTGFFGIHTVAGVDYIITDLLPTSDPGISGALWNNGGVVEVSP